MKMQIIACEKFPPYQVMRKLNEMSLRLTEFLGVSSFFFYERHPDLLDTAQVSLKKEGNAAYKTFKQMPLLPAAPAAPGEAAAAAVLSAACGAAAQTRTRTRDEQAAEQLAEHSAERPAERLAAEMAPPLAAERVVEIPARPLARRTGSRGG
jgi:hypothetical protein